MYIITREVIAQSNNLVSLFKGNGFKRFDIDLCFDEDLYPLLFKVFIFLSERGVCHRLLRSVRRACHPLYRALRFRLHYPSYSLLRR